ncbi:hypothetical protein PPN77_06505 [Proteus mirabilis]|uniref:hypothetical protein n=1 Tax=Proteus mirabilis TaxID=584 RepID=UPI0023498B9B|nr:hypothetical protein [Proteus mirabilis]EKX5058430.1 hypothetical protein [Proteus mirabilis]MDC5897863.1 hypothetical protein [Proteus mirabilis]MDC5901339.1 hypothetical protein [Proteus mirabilis]MDC5918995.1 hypothetical protein [Proteus mirabilis]MDC5929519.1 hypothetical protein [Proteus mirabilis]
MSEIPHIVTDKDIASMLLDLSNIISVLIGGVIGFIAKYLLEFKKMKEDKKAIRQQMITNNIAPMRQAWINDLRKTSSEYLSDINIITTFLKQKTKNGGTELREEWKKRVFSYAEKYAYLDLMLPLERDGHDEKEANEVREALSNLHKLCKLKNIDNMNTDNVSKATNDFKNKLKTLLKKEWEVTKSLKEIDDTNKTKKKWYLLWIK